MLKTFTRQSLKILDFPNISSNDGMIVKKVNDFSSEHAVTTEGVTYRKRVGEDLCERSIAGVNETFDGSKRTNYVRTFKMEFN